MNTHDHLGMKEAADTALCRSPNQKKLVLIWASVSIAFPLLVTICNFILNSQIAETGGLSGIGLRSTLSTIQSTLSIISSLLIPFWTLGYTAAVLRFSRNESADVTTLLEGFRLFGPAFRAILLKAVICIAVSIAVFSVSVQILSLTALVEPVFQLFDQHQDMLLSGVLEDDVANAITRAIMPVFLISCCFCFAVLIPILYRLRLTEFCLLDADHRSGVLAVRESRRMMRGNCMNLFKLDLSFWWYYLAQVLLTFLCYGDAILPIFGVTLPFSEDAAFFIFYIAAMLAQLALLYLYSNKVQTTYAVFYQALRNPPETENTLVI